MASQDLRLLPATSCTVGQDFCLRCELTQCANCNSSLSIIPNVWKLDGLCQQCNESDAVPKFCWCQAGVEYLISNNTCRACSDAYPVNTSYSLYGTRGCSFCKTRCQYCSETTAVCLQCNPGYFQAPDAPERCLSRCPANTYNNGSSLQCTPCTACSSCDG